MWGRSVNRATVWAVVYALVLLLIAGVLWYAMSPPPHETWMG